MKNATITNDWGVIENMPGAIAQSVFLTDADMRPSVGDWLKLGAMLAGCAAGLWLALVFVMTL